jgi:Flp pilus assembly protein TadG
VIIFALAVVALVAMAGLALDSGRAYVDRRALQSGVDTAALSSVQLLAYNYRGPATPKSDANVSSAVQATVNQSRSSGSDLAPFGGFSASCDATSAIVPTDLTATCAWYADQAGQLVLSPTSSGNLVAGHAVQVGTGVMPPVCPSSGNPVWGSTCTAGVAVIAYYSHPTLFLRALGIQSTSERATGTAIFAPVITTQDTGIAHYAIANCVSNSRPPQVGDSVVMRSNSWRSTYNGQCGLQGGVGSNNFKGWFHDPTTTNPSTSIPSPPPAGGCTAANCGLPTPVPVINSTGNAKTQYTEFDYFNAGGGNAIGLEGADVAIIHSSYVSCHGSPPCHYVLLPVVDYANGGGSSIDFHIVSWVAALPDQDWNSPSQGDWTATVVARVGRRADWTGCTGSSCPPPSSSTPVSIQLYR